VPVAEIGLFPLGIVLVPGERVPLHVFEPRYRELIGECLDRSVPFGLVLADEHGRRDVGTRADVVEVLERFPDGRLNVVVEGRDRFRIVEETRGRSFATAEVEDVADGDEQPDAAELERCLVAYRRVVEAARADLDELDARSGPVSFPIAARIDLGPELKQELLELESERERIVRLAPLLERAAGAVRWEREMRERAATNGRVEPP
jgi:Lon protease-like protein